MPEPSKAKGLPPHKANAKPFVFTRHPAESKSDKEVLPTLKTSPKTFFTALAKSGVRSSRFLRYSLRSDKAQATGVRRFAFCFIGGSSTPKPPDHFFE